MSFLIEPLERSEQVVPAMDTPPLDQGRFLRPRVFGRYGHTCKQIVPHSVVVTENRRGSQRPRVGRARLDEPRKRLGRGLRRRRGRHLRHLELETGQIGIHRDFKGESETRLLLTQQGCLHLLLGRRQQLLSERRYVVRGAVGGPDADGVVCRNHGDAGLITHRESAGNPFPGTGAGGPEPGGRNPSLRRILRRVLLHLRRGPYDPVNLSALFEGELPAASAPIGRCPGRKAPDALRVHPGCAL